MACLFSLSSSSSWKRFSDYKQTKNEKSGPILLKTILKIDNPVADTFIDLRDWVKGIVIVNGFVLGRYSIIGPQYFLYLPAPLLKSGDNEVRFFKFFLMFLVILQWIFHPNTKDTFLGIQRV